MPEEFPPPVVGSIVAFAEPPAGPNIWLPCTGESCDKTEYIELYSVIGGIYGEDANTFVVPLLPAAAGVPVYMLAKIVE